MLADHLETPALGPTAPSSPTHPRSRAHLHLRIGCNSLMHAPAPRQVHRAPRSPVLCNVDTLIREAEACAQCTQPQQGSDVVDELTESSDDGWRPGETFSAYERRVNVQPGVQQPRFALVDFQKPRSDWSSKPKRLSLRMCQSPSDDGQQPSETFRVPPQLASMNPTAETMAPSWRL